MSTYATTKGTTESVWTTLITRCCPTCSVIYAIPEEMRERAAQKKGEGWYCPNGHWLTPIEKTTDEKLREARDATARVRAEADRQRARADHNEARRVAQKAATTKARKRHANGVCPCCNRTFQNVQRHMASQHPDYDPSADVPRGPKP